MAGLKRHATGKGGAVDSPFEHFGQHPGLSDGKGVYDRHPNVGPPAANSGIPLLFIDEHIKTPKTKLPEASMEPVPASVHKS